jgi:hypothetical protein
MLQQASDSIDHFPAAERDLSSVIMNVPRHALPDIKQRIADFRRDLMAEFGDKEADQVVQVGIQIFPLSAPKNAPEETRETGSSKSADRPKASRASRTARRSSASKRSRPSGPETS